MPSSLHSSSPRFALFCLCALLTFSAACNREKSQAPSGARSSSAKRNAFKGKVLSVDKNAGMANIDNEPIAGFMDPMVMPYSFKPPAQINQLQPGDSISAEDVPDLKLINQSGKPVSLHQYRGQTLVLTLIYTRCPFPDFCPRVNHEFSAIDHQVRADPVRYGKTHLLSISFLPAHDPPKVPRTYGFSCAGSQDPALFPHWEFSAIPQAELPAFADYFALTYKAESGLITHSLSTAVISPDGKIFKWYHGADWQASDLLQDIAAAAHPAA